MLRDFKSLKDIFYKLNYIMTSKQKVLAIVVFLATIIGAFLETVGISVIIPLVQVFVDANAIYENKYVSKIVQLFYIDDAVELLVLISVFVILVFLLKNIYLVGLSWMRVKFASKIRRELSIKMMYSYMSRGYSYFLKVNTADVMRGVGYDINGVYEMLYNLFKIFGEVLTVMCICIFMLYTDPGMACGVILILGAALGVLMGMFRKKMVKCGISYRKATSKTQRYLMEPLQGIKEVLIFKKEKYFAQNYANAYAEQQRVEVVKTVASESPAYFVEAVCVSGLVGVIVVKMLMGANMNNFVPTLATFAVGAFRVLPSIGRISGGFNQMVYAGPALRAAYENLKEAEEFEGEIETGLIESESGKIKFEKEIEIKRLTWKYETGSRNILENLNLIIPCGTSVAFIGQSGAGKSTLVDIILGLLIPTEGDILVDGISIYDNLSAWKKKIGYVSQTIFLRDDTIRNNIAFGIEEKDIDNEKIKMVIKEAQLDKTVSELPNGLDTLMGERGVRFSGGQKQRVAIARALYNDPDVLILDEATAALDNETESAVMEAIDALRGKKTLIIVAHRLTTIRNCDYIYEIGNGTATLKKKKEIFGEG